MRKGGGSSGQSVARPVSWCIGGPAGVGLNPLTPHGPEEPRADLARRGLARSTSYQALHSALARLYRIDDFHMDRIGAGFFSEVFKEVVMLERQPVMLVRWGWGWSVKKEKKCMSHSASNVSFILSDYQRGRAESAPSGYSWGPKVSQPRPPDHSTMKSKSLSPLSTTHLMDEKSKEAAIVDPVDPKTVLEAVKAAGASLTTVLTTHHHWDHAGGNKELVSTYGQPLKVVGGDERVDGLTQLVGHGDTLTLGDLKVECLFTPCHTKGHICYSVTSDDPEHKPAVFTGDTLFIGGCGKFFEGDGKQMHHALIEVLGALPDHTVSDQDTPEPCPGLLPFHPSE
ncbi:Hydroxyacylglutathione hydrolase, mitochondrial [Chionoecetes opilio]|uniref:hydroxyacylglutathione hydrolase n=1 Tax=Chionoecetes opilio TaxID=41210 RepID=A0A8J4YNE9_CHIOP|nr:Hydroxyacylglutathione hydrolase, mitochondrial [Chionoecetes opilio]